MNHYQITKYNPEYRDENGAYTRDDWTDISDTWIEKDGIYQPSEEYLEVEQEYIDTVFYAMDLNNIEELEMKSLEIHPLFKYSDIDFENIIKSVGSIYDGKKLGKAELTNIFKLILRHEIWGQFEAESFFVHLGQDYYMFIGCLEKVKHSVVHSKFKHMFVELIDQSPYMDEEPEMEDYIKASQENFYYYHINVSDSRSAMDLYLPEHWKESPEELRIPSEEYLTLERIYSDILGEIMGENNIPYLETRNLVISPNYNFTDIDFYSLYNDVGNLYNGHLTSPRGALVLSKMILRSEIDCRLETYNFFIHFYDMFHIYIGCTSEIDLVDFNKRYPTMQFTQGLSPYLAEHNYYESDDRNWLYYPNFKDYYPEDEED